jgi:hypothetical protein
MKTAIDTSTMNQLLSIKAFTIETNKQNGASNVMFTMKGLGLPAFASLLLPPPPPLVSLPGVG